MKIIPKALDSARGLPWVHWRVIFDLILNPKLNASTSSGEFRSWIHLSTKKLAMRLPMRSTECVQLGSRPRVCEMRWPISLNCLKTFCELIAGCLGAHDTAVTLTEGFVNLLGAPELSILNSAGANIRARVQLARQLAGPLEQIALAPPAAAAPAPPAPAAAAPAPAAPAAAPAPAPLVAPDPLPGMRKIVEAVLVADKDAEGGLRALERPLRL